MKRVAVIGCPGVGKTTFSRRLNEKTGLPVVHLDFYYHQKDHNYYEDTEAWVAKVETLIKQGKWIMDGNYKSSFEPRFRRADTIFFFDFPRHVALWGALKRRVQYHNKKRADMPSDWAEKANWHFLRFILTFHKNIDPVIHEAFRTTQSKNIVTFKNRQQAEEYLNSLSK